METGFVSFDTRDLRKLDGMVIRVDGNKNELWLSPSKSVTINVGERGVKLQLEVDEDGGPPTLTLIIPVGEGGWDGPLFD